VAHEGRRTDDIVVFLSGGLQVKVVADFETLRDGLRQAIVEPGVIEITAANGKTMVLNPEHVVYLETTNVDPPRRENVRPVNGRSTATPRRLGGHVAAG
jgi:hypothetical protein